MKDSTISLKDLDIQLRRNVLHLLSRCNRFHQNPCLDNSHPGSNSELLIVLPRKFRELRALSIIQWYFPEDLRILIQTEILESKFYNLDFENKGLEQSLEILCLSTSKEVMLRYLIFQQDFSIRELFGTILRDDSINAHKHLRIYWKEQSKARRKIRRKGYRDHGSRKPDHKWTEKFDYSFTENQNTKEEKEDSILEHYTLLLEKLGEPGT